jgi:hypothetical protein
MKNLFMILLPIMFLTGLSFVTKQPYSDETQACIDCHSTITPAIVKDWEKSLHSKTTINDALEKEELARRISITENKSNVSGEIIIGCYECHSQNIESHADNFDHFGYQINVVVSPKDCAVCHPTEVDQYAGTKKFHANDNLAKNPTYHALVKTTTAIKDVVDGEIIISRDSEINANETCYACHGTEVKVDGMRIIESDLGEIEVPNLTNWPNQGVGRINPDGSRGACTSCHPRHSFSIEVARKPYTCGQCHLEPDVPAYNVYKESKHGNIFESKKSEMTFDSVPWVVGKDFTVPTCASCHNSLITDENGVVVSERTHNFSSRIWVRIFGLIYSHPQIAKGSTYEIVNQDGLGLPTTFDGRLADGLIDETEQQNRKDIMSGLCKSCHSTSWVNNQLEKVEKVNKEADDIVAVATKLMLHAWEMKIENPENPFDENIENLWVKQWLFYANSIRYATAMMGPDYAAFKNGWTEASHNLQKMNDLIKQKSNK